MAVQSIPAMGPAEDHRSPSSPSVHTKLSLQVCGSEVSFTAVQVSPGTGPSQLHAKGPLRRRHSALRDQHKKLSPHVCGSDGSDHCTHDIPATGPALLN
jgi:hypothetical protein